MKKVFRLSGFVFLAFCLVFILGSSPGVSHHGAHHGWGRICSVTCKERESLNILMGMVEEKGWKKIEKNALHAAEHPEKIDKLEFRGSDSEVAVFIGLAHELKIQFGKIAIESREKNKKAIVRHFNEMTGRCIACHEKFRDDALGRKRDSIER